jgi:hypothetical protein
MKKSIYRVMRLGLSLVLLICVFGNSMAEEKGLAFQRDALKDNSLKMLLVNETAKNDPMNMEPEPTKPGRVGGELILGSAGAIVSGTGGALIGGSTSLGGAVGGYLIASTLGAATGVYLIGNHGDKRGSFNSTLRGSVMGTLVGGGVVFVIARVTNNIGACSHDFVVSSVLIITTLQAAGATIGYNHYRRGTKIQTSPPALFSFTNGKLRWAYPAITISSHANCLAASSVSLFQADF